MRLNSDADTVWTKAFAADKFDNQRAIQTSDGGFVIAGDGDPWLIKTNANGDMIWKQAITTLNSLNNSASINCVEETADNGFVVCGTYESDIFRFAIVAKTDSLGVPVWVNTYTGEHDNAAMMVIETSDGGFAVAGAKQHPTGGGVNHGWLLRLSASGDSLWSVVYGDTANADFAMIQETADSGFVLVGLNIPTSTSDRDIYLVKTDRLGVAEWEKSLGGSYDGEGIGVIQTSDLGFTVVGYAVVDTTGGVEEVDLIIIHVDANGDSLWTRHVAGLGFDFGMDLVEISTDEYLIAGGTVTDFDTGNLEGWLVRFGDVVISVAEKPATPTVFALNANYPNPFNPTTTIGFELPVAAVVTLTVYDILGKEIVRLENRLIGAGYHQATWNGRTSNGREAPTGIYFARLVTPTSTRTIKMVLLK